MNKNIETNRNWEVLIDELNINQIQKFNAKEKIYDNQFQAAKDFIKGMMSYKSPDETEFTSRNRHLLVSALPQSGKTGFMCAVTNIINTIPGFKEYHKINSVWFITGMNDLGLHSQTKDRILDQIIGANDQNIITSFKDVKKTKNPIFINFRNQDLRSPEKLGIKKGDLKNCLIFIDEAHYGTKETSIMEKFFQYHGIETFKNSTKLRDKNIYISSISATNTSEIFSDISETKQHILLNPAQTYYGPEEFRENKQIFKATNDDFRINDETLEEPIITYIKTAYDDMCKFNEIKIKVRYNPENGEPMRLPKGCIFIRVTKKHEHVITENQWVINHFQTPIAIDATNSTKVDYNEVYIRFRNMLDSPDKDKDGKPIIFLIKGGYRAGITIDPLIKDYTFMVYDRSGNVLSTIQGLMGRMCGVRENWDIAKFTKLYVDEQHVHSYVNWKMSNFNRENLPGKVKWTSSDRLSRKQIESRIFSTDFNSKTDIQWGSEYVENIYLKITDEDIEKLYGTHSRLHGKVKNSKYKFKAVETREEIIEEILKPYGCDKLFDFVAEVYLMPGGFNNGIDIFGVDRGKVYSSKFEKDWWLGKGVGGVKDHGHKHFCYKFGRKYDEGFRFDEDEGLMATHIVLNDIKKELKLCIRRVVAKFKIEDPTGWYEKNKDTTMSENLIK